VIALWFSLREDPLLASQINSDFISMITLRELQLQLLLAWLFGQSRYLIN